MHTPTILEIIAAVAFITVLFYLREKHWEKTHGKDRMSW
jgi:uncharacterized membrane protein